MPPGPPMCYCTTCSARSTARKASWGHAIGGMGAITQAMAKAAAERGVEIRVAAPVAKFWSRAAARWARSPKTGETIRARSVVSNLNPKLLYGSLIDPAVLPQDFRERIESLALRIRHLPHECRAVGTAGLQGAARPCARRSSHRRHHHGAEPCVHGASLFSNT